MTWPFIALSVTNPVHRIECWSGVCLSKDPFLGLGETDLGVSSGQEYTCNRGGENSNERNSRGGLKGMPESERRGWAPYSLEAWFPWPFCWMVFTLESQKYKTAVPKYDKILVHPNSLRHCYVVSFHPLKSKGERWVHSVLKHEWLCSADHRGCVELKFAIIVKIL